MTREGHHFRWHYGELDDKNFQLHGRSLLLVLLLLFSAILLFVLLCIYFRRPCHFRTTAVNAGSGSGRGGGGGGMEEAEVSRLPLRVRRDEAAACSICLSMVMEGDKERVLPGCDHGFHPGCVDEWLKKQSSCPLCRAKVVGDEGNLPITPDEVVGAA